MRKSTRRKRRDVNPHAHLTAIAGVGLLSKTQQNRLIHRSNEAMSRILVSQATRQDWADMTQLVLLIEALAKTRTVKNASVLLEDAMHTLDRCILTPNTRPRPADAEVLQDLVSIWAGLVGQITHTELHRATVMAVNKQNGALAKARVEAPTEPEESPA